MHSSQQAWQDLLNPGDATDFFLRPSFNPQPFNPNAVGYSRDNALWLAELSRLVYRHDIEENVPPPLPTRTSFLMKAGFKQRQFFLSWDTDTQAMLVESGGESPFAVLVFRGTEQNSKDLLIDLDTGNLPLDLNNSDVHDGFLQAIDSVWNEINAALNHVTCPIFYTGHSLGAALATLAAEKRPPTAVYTFGSPVVGNQAFVNSLSVVPIYRIVDDQDIVTTRPPTITGFEHVGILQQLVAIPPSSPPKIESFVKNLFDPPKPLNDHAPINYVDRL